MNTVEKKLSQSDNIEEIQLKGKNKGFLVLGLYFALLLVSIVLFIVNVNVLDKGDGNALNIALLVISILYWALGWIMLLGLKVLKPQELLFLSLFGQCIVHSKGARFYSVSPS